MSRTVTRAHLAAAVRDAVVITHDEAAELVDATLEMIAAEAVATRRPVKISRFGSFVPWRSPERMGCNPKRPAEKHVITSRWRLLFKASPELKDLINRNG